MSKKEKIIAMCFSISMVLMIFSSIYTIISNKPDGYKFRIEKIFKKLI